MFQLEWVPCMKVLVVDLDNTISFMPDHLDQTMAPTERYRQAVPNLAVIEKLRFYKSMGYEITIFTSRNMRTFKGDIDKIKAHTLPIILEWLDAITCLSTTCRLESRGADLMDFTLMTGRSALPNSSAAATKMYFASSIVT